MNEEDEELDDENLVADEQENDGSSAVDKAGDAVDKVRDTKHKIDDVKDLIEKMKNNSSKSGTPDGSVASPKSGADGGKGANGNNGTNGGTGTEGSGGTGSTGGTEGSGGTGSTGGVDGANGTGGSGGASGTSGTGGSGSAGGTGSAGTSGSAGSAGTAGGGTATAEAGAGTATTATAEAGATTGAAATGEAVGAGVGAGVGLTLGMILLIVIVVILLLLMLIGFLSFLFDGVGLITGKISAFLDDIWTAIKAGAIGADSAQVSQQKIIDVATYLEEMGYNLEGFGFLDSNGKHTTTDSDGTVKDSNGNIILKREAEENSNNKKITSVKSSCIESYLTAENRTYLIDNTTWSVVGLWNSIFGNEETAGSGMIVIRDENGNYEGPIFSKANNVSVNRKNEELIIDVDRYKYSYGLDGWAGRYGKSLEFLLTLHLATMSPGFATEVALNEEFDAKVYVGLKEVEATISIVDENGNKINQNDVSADVWEAIQEYEGNIKTYTPYIQKVENHWYYKLINFENSYTEIENTSYPNDNSEEQEFTYIYEYIGLGRDEDILANQNFYVKEVRKSDLRQESEPEVTPRTYEADGELSLQKILLGGDPGEENTIEDYKFYIYDGSSIVDPNETREQRYIIQKTGFGESKEYVMDTRFFQYAFAILDSVHTQDAEYVLRDLKQLFYDLGIEIEQNQEEQPVRGLEWILPDYIPTVWDPMFNSNETRLTINARSNAKSGFDEDVEVVMPADGEIVKVSDNDSEGQTKTLKIEFTGTDDESLKGMTMYISGIKSDVQVGNVISRGNNIGITSTMDITIIMTDKTHSPIINIDDYIYPPTDKMEEIIKQ